MLTFEVKRLVQVQVFDGASKGLESDLTLEDPSERGVIHLWYERETVRKVGNVHVVSTDLDKGTKCPACLPAGTQKKRGGD